MDEANSMDTVEIDADGKAVPRTPEGKNALEAIRRAQAISNHPAAETLLGKLAPKKTKMTILTSGH